MLFMMELLIGWLERSQRTASEENRRHRIHMPILSTFEVDSVRRRGREGRLGVKEYFMTTEIGKELRKIRIDQDERLLDMAAKIDKSSAFLSAVEVGKKQPPAGFEELVIRAYRLAADAADALRRAADRSRSAFSLQPTSLLGRDTAGLLARRMDSLSEDQLAGIREILERKKG
jgi:hypothetical protein